MLHLILIGAMLTSAVPQAAAPASFCRRLAPKLNMEPTTRIRDGKAMQEWKVNQLGGIGQLLFGGNAVVSFQAAPVVPDLAEAGRLENACGASQKGAICTVEGPAKLTVGTGKGKVVEEVAVGEKPTIEMYGTSIYCRDG